jgi:hypothetical protein
MTILQAFSILLSLFGTAAPDAGSLSVSAIARETGIHLIGLAPPIMDGRQPLAGIKPI